MAEIWVFCEETDGAPSTLGLELLAKARELGEPTVLYAGSGSEQSWEALGDHGARRVLVFDHGDSLAGAPVAAAIAALAEEHSPGVILFGQAYTDRDVAGRLAVRLGLSVLSNAVDVTLEPDGAATTRHEISGGAEIAVAAFRGPRPHLAIIRPKSFPADPVGGPPPEVIPVEIPDVGGAGAVVTERHARERQGPDLEEAAVIVSGGRGLGGAEHYSMVESLAAP
ncbi:MAG: electron transfer flavoprotein subunit alpha/FixB family protein, partial [Acidimicrobiia bacterium]|nr:electron transfer flavoprotein subunit alpha/FixB family protein [Acidimicrobiia bacterium]